MPAIPHTITRDEFSHCAFTGKVKRFAPMMRSRGFEVYHYGVETSESGADVDVQLLTKEEWLQLRLESSKIIHPKLSIEELQKKLEDPKAYVGDLGNVTYPIYKEFNRRLRIELQKHYRSTSTDILCLPFGPANEEATQGFDYIQVESGIGYPNAYKSFRIYESYAKLHMNMQRDDKQLENYWFVCPNYFDVAQWPLSLTPKVDTIGYFGRLEHIKGISIVIEVALLFPHIRVIICGQGDPTPFLTVPNIVYKTPIHGDERGKYLGSLMCLLAPSKWPEPFCGVSAEAQLCGTPVIGHDCGAIVENVEAFKTGLHCHTLADFKYGVQMALDGKFDRQYIRDRAVRLFDMYNIAKRYEHAFKSIIDIYNGTNGWYSPNQHIKCLDPTNKLEDMSKKEWESWPVPKESDNYKFKDKIAFIPESFPFSGIYPSQIPRILHCIWVGSAAPPSTLKTYLDTWYKLMPSWEIRLWTNADITTRNFPEKAIALINKAEKGAQKADIMRYFIIERYGGVYMDVDVIPTRSLEPLVTSFKDATIIVCHDIPLTWEYISIGFFAAAPHHPVIQTATSLCYKAELNTEDIHLKTGPFILGTAVATTGITARNEKSYLLPSNYFYRNEEFTGRFGTHTYAKMW